MPKLLVVDDETAIREALQFVLTDQGHKVDLAADTESALPLVLQNNYDLVLTDLYMPGKNGFELIKSIRQQWGKKLPVIIMTAYGSPDNAALAINEGISDFIIKPFEIHTLTDAVKYALDKTANSPATANTSLPVSPEPPRQAYSRQEFERKFFGLSVLDEISKTVSFSTEIDKIGSMLLALVAPLVNPDRAVLVVHQKQKTNFRYQGFYARKGERQGTLLPLDLDVLKSMGPNGQALFVTNPGSDPVAQSWDKSHVGSVMALPFLRQNTLLGALLLYRDPGEAFFQQEEFVFLGVLANMTAIALENADLYDDLKSYFTSTIRALISTVEIKDPTVYGHSTRVARYAVLVAKALSLSEVELRRLEYLALLHDIGKIGIPESVLFKTNNLTAEEELLFRTHVTLGENIVRSIHFLPGGDKIIRHHHEFFNGRGYPDGLQGSAIPLFSRIISIANRFDQLMQAHSAQDPDRGEKCLEEIRRQADIQFDPALVRIFEQAYTASKSQAGGA